MTKRKRNCHRMALTIIMNGIVELIGSRSVVTLMQDIKLIYKYMKKQITIL